MRQIAGCELSPMIKGAKPITDEDYAALAAALASTAAHAQSQGSDLDTVLSHAGIGILHRDTSDHVLLVNSAYCSLVGRTAEALEGLPFCRFTHPDDVERLTPIYEEHFSRAQPFRIEKRYIRPDGSVVWCVVHVAFLLDDNGQPRSTVVVASDISARRKAEDELRESEEHYRYAVELNPQISWIAAADGAIAEVSPRWHEVTGVSQADALGESWIAVVHPDDVDRTRLTWATSLASGEPVDLEYRLKTAGGSYRWFRSRAAARFDQAGSVVRWYGTLEDVHDRRLAQNDLRGSEERFRLAAQAANLGIWDYDALSGQREWSAEFKAMLGLPLTAIPSVTAAMEMVVPEDRHLLDGLVQAAQSGDSSARFEVTLRVRRNDDGAERWMRTAGWRMHASSGRLTRVLVTIRDVTEERSAEDRIRWVATHDTLSGIPNRFYFNSKFEQAIATAAPNAEIALVLLDVDRLKEVNDTIGHDAGDMLLKIFADRLSYAFGRDAKIGRLGGDEFAVLVENVARGDLPTLVSNALETLRQPFEHEGHACDAQATAGVSIFRKDGVTAAELLKAADIALYVGKASRRGEVSMFEPEMRSGLQRRASMLHVAKIVAREKRIIPHYQPKVDLKTGTIIGFEALLRWRHDCLGIQSPDAISAAFDDFRIAAALSDQMIDQVSRDFRSWLDLGLKPGKIAINLSPAEFRDERLAQRVLDLLCKHAVPFESIEVEITETVLLGRDSDRVAATLGKFADSGLTIALDDFGTGFASLTHLKMFPVDVIKIDKSFVSKMCDQLHDAAIVETIVSLGQRLGMQVVAEGIESEEQAGYLRSLGCTYGQGYYFGRAEPAATAAALISGGQKICRVPKAATQLATLL